MKRSFIAIIALILSLALISCGEQTEHDAPDAPDSIETYADTESSAPATEADTHRAQTDAVIPSVINTADDIYRLLCGSWGYYEQKAGVADSQYDISFLGVQIDYSADGTFAAYRFSENGDVTVYGGTWSASVAPRDPRVVFDLQTAQDGLRSFGSFKIRGVSYCDGELLMNMRSDEDSVFSEYYSARSVTMVRIDLPDMPSPEIPREMKGAHFTAICWKTADEGGTVWLGDINSGDFAHYPQLFKASKFTFAPGADVRCDISLLAPGGVAAEVETNDKGEITMICNLQ